jgi:hypothetical protein
MVNLTGLPQAGDSIVGLASLLVSCVAEEEQLLDSICQASDKNDTNEVILLVRQLSNLRINTTDSKLSVISL